MVDYYVPLYPLLRSTTSSRMSTVIDHHAPLLIPPVAVDHIVPYCMSIMPDYYVPLHPTAAIDHIVPYAMCCCFESPVLPAQPFSVFCHT
ncbi:hypothetical protein M422DRAFT_30259 [Sphaerobolus stellatus SS14]|uniref:Uncharacterized protein n=1 Tax=Sphaerobolus stellatus (strain SS14) TaxID=990650 RepID=A0A0C9W1F8_SPHS4|nr:hypothetical protein M422DRAFT_30259 [Sphaerobolus stellatus SS14]